MTAGRPAFQPSEEQRRVVRRLAKAGVGERDMAKVLGIDRGTLRASALADEIAAARVQAKLRLVGRLNRLAGKGNVSAINSLLRLLSHADSHATPVDGDPSTDGGRDSK
jgi:hypothetical protein